MRPTEIVVSPVTADDLAASLVDAARMLTKAAARAASEGSGEPRLTRAQVEAMLAIGREPGATVTQLAEGLRRAPNTVSTIIGQLDRLGLVTRHADTSDARVVRLSLTAAAVRRMALWRGRQAAAVAGALEALSPAERGAAERAIGPIRALAAAIEHRAVSHPAGSGSDRAWA